MAIPHRVPIAHEPAYHTDTIGRYDGGQFFAGKSEDETASIKIAEESLTGWLEDHAEFLPDDLGFDPPWDGLYDI
jgi:hypothetical protein